MHFDAPHDGGNIQVLNATDPSHVRLRIRPDPPTRTGTSMVRFFQWFSLRVVGARGVPLGLHLEGLAASAYPDGWPGYRACVSHDGRTWVRAATSFDGDTLRIDVVPEGDVLLVAYFEPYPLSRLACALTRWGCHPAARIDVIGRTLDGRTLDRLTLGDTPDTPVVWAIARQHPGETMASFWMEGFVDRLLSNDPVAASVRERTRIHVVPHMNPDGGFRGHLRTNAVGTNLNRAWDTPSAAWSPEVLATRRAMDATGVDLCLDVHGDEAIPHVFLAGAEGIPDWSDDRARALQRLRDTVSACTPDFQQVHGYPPNAPGTADLSMCTNQVAQRYGALAVTLEMPFKDHDDRPDPVHGWSAARSAALGAAFVDVLDRTVDGLRA